jgi:hypothetical protein
MIVNSTPIYGYDFTNYNSGTGIWQSGLIPAPLPNGNVRCGTLTTTGGILPGGYSPTALYFLFFVSGVGGGFGLANSYANALAKIPVIFTTGGTGTIVFRESGGYYNLQAKVPECCDEPYFNQQFPSFD